MGKQIELNIFEKLKYEYKIIKKSYICKPLTSELLHEYEVELEELFYKYDLKNLIYKVGYDMLNMNSIMIIPFNTITELVFYFLER